MYHVKLAILLLSKREEQMEAKKTRKMYIYALDEKSKRNQKEEGEMSQLHGEPTFHFVSNVTLASKEEISSVCSLAAILALKALPLEIQQHWHLSHLSVQAAVSSCF